MTVVYLDKVFVLNTTIDYLLLLCTARLSGIPLRRGRLLFCASLGGLYALAVFFPACAFLSPPLARIAAGAAMALLAFLPQRKPYRLTLLFIILSSALAGIVLGIALLAGSAGALSSRLYYADISWPLLLSTTLFLDLLLNFLFHQGARHGGGELMTVTISINGHRQQITALHDTGNTLRDPLNGRPVLVSEQSALLDSWPADIRNILTSTIPAEEKMAKLYNSGVGAVFTLLPFRSVGVSSGLLLATRSDYIKIGKSTHRRALIALSQTPVSDGGAYQALWGGTERRDMVYESSAEALHMDPQEQQAG